jgi:hypothetical protein
MLSTYWINEVFLYLRPWLITGVSPRGGFETISKNSGRDGDAWSLPSGIDLAVKTRKEMGIIR